MWSEYNNFQDNHLNQKEVNEDFEWYLNKLNYEKIYPLITTTIINSDYFIWDYINLNNLKQELVNKEWINDKPKNSVWLSIYNDNIPGYWSDDWNTGGWKLYLKKYKLNGNFIAINTSYSLITYLNNITDFPRIDITSSDVQMGKRYGFDKGHMEISGIVWLEATWDFWGEKAQNKIHEIIWSTRLHWNYGNKTSYFPYIWWNIEIHRENTLLKNTIKANTQLWLKHQSVNITYNVGIKVNKNITLWANASWWYEMNKIPVEAIMQSFNNWIQATCWVFGKIDLFNKTCTIELGVDSILAWWYQPWPFSKIRRGGDVNSFWPHVKIVYCF